LNEIKYGDKYILWIKFEKDPVLMLQDDKQSNILIYMK